MVPSNSEQVSSGCWLYQLSDQYLKEVLIGKLRKSSIDKQIDISNSPQILANIDWSKFESFMGRGFSKNKLKGWTFEAEIASGFSFMILKGAEEVIVL